MLLQVSTKDGLFLHGFYSPSNDKKNIILHIHGFEGNFYENNFIYVLDEYLRNSNIAFLTVNTRGNGTITDFNTTDGKIKTIGAWNELLEDAHVDISAWIKYLIDQNYENIILQGHSLGTMKVVRYLFEGEYKDKINKLILLAPFEKTLPPNLSQQTIESWTNPEKFSKMFDFSYSNYDFSILKEIKIPVKIIVGSKDECFFPSHPNNFQQAMDILLKHIPHSSGVFIPDAFHSFKPNELLMAKEVVDFIQNS